MTQDDNSADWVRVQATTLIDRSPEIVFRFACDPLNDGQWLTNVGKTGNLPGADGLKSRFRQFPIFLGAPVEVEWEVVESSPIAA